MIVADKTALGLLKIILTQLDYSYEQISRESRLTPSKFGMVVSGNRTYNTREWLRIITKIDERIEAKKEALEGMEQLSFVQQNVKKFREKIFNIVFPDGPILEKASNYIEKPYINTLLGYVVTSPSDCLTKVVGPPKSGKTSLLHKFSEKLEEEYLGSCCFIDFNSWDFKAGSKITASRIIEKIIEDILIKFPRTQLPVVPTAKNFSEEELLKEWLKDCFNIFYNSLKPKENLFLILDNLDGIYLYQEKTEITKTEAILNHLLKVTLNDLFELNANKNIFAIVSFAALMKPESSAVESSDLDLHTTQFVNIDYFTKEDIDYMLELIGCSKKINFEDGQSTIIRESLLKLYHGCPYLTSHALYIIFKSDAEEYNENDLRESMIEYEDVLWKQSITFLDAQIRTLNVDKIVDSQKIIDNFISESSKPTYAKYSVLLQKLYIEHLGKESSRFPFYVIDANNRNKAK